MTWLYPLGLLGLLAVPAVIVLSLWRWRRRDVAVPSLMLWRGLAAAARQAPRSRRRRRVDPLLVLRVAVAVALAGALCGLAWVRPERVARRLVIVADLSASMAARRPDGRTRWQACADELRALIDRAGADGRVTVVPLPPPTLSFVRQRDSGLATLADLAPQSASLEPSELVNAAANALRGHPGALVVVATDRQIEGLPEGIHVLAKGDASDNLGIVAFAEARRPGGGHEVLVGVASASAGEMSVEVTLLGDGRELGRQRSTVPARGRVSVVFDVPIGSVAELAARLEGGDALPLDDRAWLRRSPRPARVALLGEPSPALRRALAAQEGVTVVEAASGAVEPPDGALAVYYRSVPSRLDRGRIVVVAPSQSVGSLRLAGEAEVGEGAVVAPRDPLMAAVRLDGVRVGPAARLLAPPGFETLARAGDVPLIGRWREGEAEAVYVGIDPARSTWPLSPSFPIFWANATAWGGAGATCFAASGLLDPAETQAVGDETWLPEGLATELAPRTQATVARRLTGWLAIVGLALVVAHGWLAARAQG